MSKLAAEPAEMYELGKPPIPMTVKCLSFLWLSWGKWITQGHREMCETLRARHPWAPVGWTVAYHGNVTGEPWRYCGVNMHVHQMEIWMDGWSYIYIFAIWYIDGLMHIQRVMATICSFSRWNPQGHGVYPSDDWENRCQMLGGWLMLVNFAHSAHSPVACCSLSLVNKVY